MTRVVIADDHKFFRSGVEAALRAYGVDVVASVEDGDAALKSIAETNPDIVILDINMPGRNGVMTLEALRLAGDKRPVIVLVAELEDDALVAIIRAGVNAIVFKAGAELQLFDAIKAIKQGMRFIDFDLLDRAFSLASESTSESALDKLTSRERQIVKEIALGLRNRDIAKKLEVTEGTIKIYLHNIYNKLGINSRTELAIIALNDASS